MKTIVLAASAAATLIGGGAAAAQTHGYAGSAGFDARALPAPAYAYDSHAFQVYERPARKGFPLLGAEAGVTVLGVHVGGSAKIRVGLDEELQHRRRVYVSRSAGYAAPAAPSYGYAPPAENPCCERGSW